MTNETKHAGWKLWILWVLVYAITYVLISKGDFSYFLNIAGGNLEYWHEFLPIYVFFVFIAGLIISLLHWLILKPYGIPFWWIFATLIGILLSGFENEGLIIGTILQSLILWKRVSYAGVWIVANYLTLYIYSNVSVHLHSYLNNYLHEYRHLGEHTYPLIINLLRQDISLARYITTGLLGGIVTASVLVWLLRHPKPKSTSQPE